MTNAVVTQKQLNEKEVPTSLYWQINVKQDSKAKIVWRPTLSKKQQPLLSLLVGGRIFNFRMTGKRARMLAEWLTDTYAPWAESFPNRGGR